MTVDGGDVPAESLYERLRIPDARTLRFAPGLLLTTSTMKPESSAEYLSRLVGLPVAEAVDDDVRRSIDRVRAVFCHGLFDYDLLTAAQSLAYLLVEGALRRRFVHAYGGVVPFVQEDRTEALATDSFDDVNAAVRRGGSYASDRGWRLHELGGGVHKDFDASYASLMKWARRGQLLSGQRNRAIEQALIRLRNVVAHPERYSLGHPADAALPIRDAIEIVNRLWGATTEGGRRAARAALTAAFDQLPSTACRARILTLTDLAMAELRAGNLPDACRHAITAADLRHHTPYATGTTRLRAFRATASPPPRSTDTARP